VIDFPIGLMTLDILVPILQSGDCENGQEGQDDETGRDGREFGKELQDIDGEEETVGDTSKLFQQVSRQESDYRVLGGNDLICWVNEFLLDFALFVNIVGRQ
jgi:hypothetical protein